jgi:hypothetical protein
MVSPVALRPFSLTSTSSSGLDAGRSATVDKEFGLVINISVDWVLDIGYWILGIGYSVVERVPSGREITEYPIPNIN